ncbi:hypothetical protein XH90_14750 [Bradyrhizobium sp. CCBAU 53338]|nr:hypothetical protein XH90_14750 [Bradyrhizobium sp. CCBAU 53338]
MPRATTCLLPFGTGRFFMIRGAEVALNWMGRDRRLAFADTPIAPHVGLPRAGGRNGAPWSRALWPTAVQALYALIAKRDWSSLPRKIESHLLLTII